MWTDTKCFYCFHLCACRRERESCEREGARSSSKGKQKKWRTSCAGKKWKTGVWQPRLIPGWSARRWISVRFWWRWLAAWVWISRLEDRCCDWWSVHVGDSSTVQQWQRWPRDCVARLLQRLPFEGQGETVVLCVSVCVCVCVCVYVCVCVHACTCVLVRLVFTKIANVLQLLFCL